MKNIIKALAFIGLLILSLSVVSPYCFADEGITESPSIKIYVNGSVSSFADVPIIMSGRTLLPLRAILTSLGVPNDDQHIIWDSAARSITIVKESSKVYLKVGDNTAYINSSPVKLDVAPVIYSKNGRTYIPARFVAQALGNEVAWDKYLKRIYIQNRDDYNKVKQIVDEAIATMDGFEKFIIYNKSLDAYSDTTKKIEIDRKNRITHYSTYYGSDILSMNYESYSLNDLLYVCYDWSNGPSGNWKKVIQPGVSFDSEFSSAYYDQIINARDVIYAGLRIEEDLANNRYILKGDVFPVLKSLEKSGGYYDDPTRQFVDGSMEIFIDMKSNCITQINEQNTVGSEGNLYNYSNSYYYEEFNGDFNIKIPEEVLNAPEGEGF